MSMTMILLTVSVGCNLWFLFLLLYDRIMETRFVRFLKGIAGLWRSLDGTEVKQEIIRETPPAETSDIIGKSRFKMASSRTTAAIPTQEAATSEKGIELSEEEATFDDGNTETVSYPAQVPEENSMKPSRASRLRNWSSGRMNRRTERPTHRELREAVLTR